jgi:hypothetical protein
MRTYPSRPSRGAWNPVPSARESLDTGFRRDDGWNFMGTGQAPDSSPKAAAAGFFGTELGTFGKPDERKVHFSPVSRVGGIAIVLFFQVTLFGTGFLLRSDRIPVVGSGPADDFHRTK